MASVKIEDVECEQNQFSGVTFGRKKSVFFVR